MNQENIFEAETVGSRQGWLAISPALVFLILYVVVSILIGDFYKMPITVALGAASVWAIAIFRGRSLSQRIEVFSRAAGHDNILYMVWIFILAGAFASLAKGIGAIDATVNLTLRFFPSGFMLPAIFAAACFISMSVGTSVGTVVALTPLVVEMAETTGGGTGHVALFVATVLGGAFFGDNLSFISDTTIAATRSQGCSMADKFKANIRVVLPAAIIALAVYFFIGREINFPQVTAQADYWLIIPYMVIIATALSGINVTLVLLCGIASAIVIGLWRTDIGLLSQCSLMGDGIDSMGQLIIITLLASGMLGTIKAMGGINFILQKLTSHVSRPRGARWTIALLVAIVNLCTANNTVAIITVGGVSREIASRFNIPPRYSASILDTCSCIVQCLIPYGAQTLLATGLADISPAAPWPYLFYPWALTLCVAVTITFCNRILPKR
ncbi:MAG: Na+/H+ antiporter NhaC family protein [Paramuribaculum sp.]|nr:Na+/H+ antiporter NhaC family protein [Paramuribaculum sp.]